MKNSCQPLCQPIERGRKVRIRFLVWVVLKILEISSEAELIVLDSSRKGGSGTEENCGCGGLTIMVPVWLTPQGGKKKERKRHWWGWCLYLYTRSAMTEPASVCNILGFVVSSRPFMSLTEPGRLCIPSGNLTASFVYRESHLP